MMLLVLVVVRAAALAGMVSMAVTTVMALATIRATTVMVVMAA